MGCASCIFFQGALPAHTYWTCVRAWLACQVSMDPSAFFCAPLGPQLRADAVATVRCRVHPPFPPLDCERTDASPPQSCLGSPSRLAADARGRVGCCILDWLRPSRGGQSACWPCSATPRCPSTNDARWCPGPCVRITQWALSCASARETGNMEFAMDARVEVVVLVIGWMYTSTIGTLVPSPVGREIYMLGL